MGPGWRYGLSPRKGSYGVRSISSPTAPSFRQRRQGNEFSSSTVTALVDGDEYLDSSRGEGRARTRSVAGSCVVVGYTGVLVPTCALGAFTLTVSAIVKYRR